MHYLIATDFFPKIGGAHYWVYQIYIRWPERIYAFVPNYSRDRLLKSLQEKFDRDNHGSLLLKRCDFSLKTCGFISFYDLYKYYLFYRRVQSYLGSESYFHLLRTIPDFNFVFWLKFLSRKNIKFIIYAHGEEFLMAKTSLEFKLITKFALKNASLLIANSNYTKKNILQFYPHAKVEVIHLGVNFQDYQVSNSSVFRFREKYSLPKKSLTLLTVARLEARKNHERVLRAISQLKKEGVSLSYLIVGTGEEENKLKRLAIDLGINDCIYFLGRLSEKEKILAYNIADIFILPSVQMGASTEGFGIVFMEAAAAGVPSIAGNVGGQPEAVIHGKTGLVVDGNNVDEIVNAIRYLIKNPDVRKCMGQEAKKWAKEHDWERIAKITYEKINEYIYRK